MWTMNELCSEDVISPLQFPANSSKTVGHERDQELLSVLNVVQMTSSIGRVLVQLATLNRDVRLSRVIF
jgi:hypothetical protein